MQLKKIINLIYYFFHPPSILILTLKPKKCIKCSRIMFEGRAADRHGRSRGNGGCGIGRCTPPPPSPVPKLLWLRPDSHPLKTLLSPCSTPLLTTKALALSPSSPYTTGFKARTERVWESRKIWDEPERQESKGTRKAEGPLPSLFCIIDICVLREEP